MRLHLDLKLGTQLPKNTEAYKRILYTKLIKNHINQDWRLQSPTVKTNKKKQEVIVIDKGDELYGDIVRKMRSKIDINQTGKSISKIRETRNGNVLIEVDGGNEA